MLMAAAATTIIHQNTAAITKLRCKRNTQHSNDKTCYYENYKPLSSLKNVHVCRYTSGQLLRRLTQKPGKTL
jgi:hypothetical protein